MKLTCPSDDQLRAFLEGVAGDAELDRIVDHIEGCSRCDEVIADLESRQSHVVKQLREGLRVSSLLDEPEFLRLRHAVGVRQIELGTVPDGSPASESGRFFRFQPRHLRVKGFSIVFRESIGPGLAHAPFTSGCVREN